jgi:hypothetical protein
MLDYGSKSGDEHKRHGSPAPIGKMLIFAPGSVVKGSRACGFLNAALPFIHRCPASIT